MRQVKFYSKASLPTGADLDENGVYFINGGELYKGSQRFGLGKVTISESTTGITGMARGDIVVTGSGAGWVYAGPEDGKGWQKLGGDIGSLQSMWQADIKTWTAGLAKGGTGSYITGITQAADGKVTASVSNFADDVKTAVGNSTVSGANNGVTVSVTTTSGKVTAVEVTAPAEKTWTAIDVGDANSYIYNVTQGTDGQVSALAKAFPTLGTGTTDGTVKLGTGADADAKVSGWDTVKTDITNLQAVVSNSGTGAKTVTADTVTATTGNFTNLNVSDTATFSATTVSADSLTIGGSTVEQLADKQIASIAQVTQTGASNGITVSVTTKSGSVTAVSVDATAFGNVMKFRGVVTSTADITDPVAGNIVVIGSNPTGGAVAGQEYIYTDEKKWELIGDQNTYALNAYTSTATVYSGVETVPGALNAAGAAIDALYTNIDTKAQVGDSRTGATHGVSVAMSLYANAAPTIGITVDAITTSTGVSTGVDKVVTAGAVADYVTDAISTATAYTPSETVTANATTLDGAMHKVAAAVDTLNTDIATKASAGTATATAVAGIGGTVTFSSNAAPTFTMAVDVPTLKSALGLGTAASKAFATEVTANGTELPTQSAVYSFVTDLISGLDATVSSTAGNVGVTVTQTNGKLTSCAVTFDWITDPEPESQP